MVFEVKSCILKQLMMFIWQGEKRYLDLSFPSIIVLHVSLDNEIRLNLNESWVQQPITYCMLEQLSVVLL